MSKSRSAKIALVICVVVLLAGGIAAVVRTTSSSAGRTNLAAYFDNSNGIYAGDEVRVLGVRVGEITGIEVQPERVKIAFWVDKKYKVPADARALIVSPSLVSSRAIELTPVFNGGPEMPNGTVIPEQRTAVPVEWDDFRDQLEKLTATLQPTAPGGTSTLGAMINTAADNLRGQGPNIRDTIIELSRAFSALGEHSGDIFGTVRNLAILVSALRDSTDLMGQLNKNLGSATSLLVDDPDEISRAAADFSTAVGDVSMFIADNKEALGTTSEKLASVSQALVDSVDDIEQTLHVAPTTFANFINIYQPAQAAVTGTIVMNNFANPINFLCGGIQAASRMNAEQSAKLCVQYLAPIFKNRQYNFSPLGENILLGAQARPNEITYSEDWMRPDFVPPAAAGEAPTALPAEATATNPSEGLSGMMVPGGGGA